MKQEIFASPGSHGNLTWRVKQKEAINFVISLLSYSKPFYVEKHIFCLLPILRYL